MTAVADSPRERIRAATQTLHARVDASAYARAVLDGSLPLERYAAFLRALDVVHSELEHLVEAAKPGVVRDAAAHAAERRARLERDLRYLGVDPHGIDGAALHALVYAQQIRRDARRSDAMLLGHLYVVEGSQLGGLSLTTRAELQRGGLEYLAGVGRATADRFRGFVDALDAYLADEAAVADAIAGARHAFEGFEAMLDAAMSSRIDHALAAALNREAGTHAIASDVRELAAALKAGERSRTEWTYYDARYGERGLRFTRSDSAWLVTLAREDARNTRSQIAWLGRVLASRGMPRLLLEQHLLLLHAELARAVPERAAAYATLQRAAADLARERQAVLGDAELDRLASGFVRAASGGAGQAGPASPVPALEAGKLLVAAVLDEQAGIAKAVESVCQWLDDPARFSAAWRDALKQTVAAARHACQSRASARRTV